MNNENDQYKYLTEKMNITFELFAPIFQELRLPFQTEVKKRKSGGCDETIILGQGYRINVNINSISANIGVISGFLALYFEDPKGYYNGSYTRKVQGLYKEKENDQENT